MANWRCMDEVRGGIEDLGYIYSSGNGLGGAIRRFLRWHDPTVTTINNLVVQRRG